MYNKFANFGDFLFYRGKIILKKRIEGYEKVGQRYVLIEMYRMVVDVELALSSEKEGKNWAH